ncbi:hypothetical protein EVAR_38457_1 [Eumeta japonica]|uniref:Protein takeout n=1 Tax=Eumeta variegata TaxID=151549 RepID=A0A4C1WLZ8_EUMVA|nr:hypothetical protein EVAR_38457_1 [Eumeta japonica]
MLQKFVVILSLCCLYHGVDCQSTLLKVLKPCAASDGECLKILWHDAVQTLADNGDKELDISPLDPMVLQNITVNIPGLIELTLIDGTAVGLKSCKFDDVKTDLSKGAMNVTISLHCTLTIGVHYKVSAQSSIIPGLAANELLKADGQGKIKMSNVVLAFVNGNWKLVMDTFGGAFFDRGIIIFTDLIRRVFKNTPAKAFMSDDLDQYFITVSSSIPILRPALDFDPSTSPDFYSGFDMDFDPNLALYVDITPAFDSAPDSIFDPKH